MEGIRIAAHRRRLLLWGSGAALAAFLLRDVLRALGMQVLAASVLMLFALPVCRLLEKRLPGGIAAFLALLSLLAAAAVLCVAALPPVIRQLQQLTVLLPGLAADLQAGLRQVTAWLDARGIDLAPLWEGLLGKATNLAGNMVSRAVSAARSAVSGLSQMLLSPLLAFYLLRDRRKLTAAMTLLLPVKDRSRGVRAAREMRRETAAYLRGQLVLSLAVGGMTTLVLALTDTPGWLLLGALMAVMELIPYIGPVIAGAPAVLLALQGGWGHALWTLLLLMAVQELEGAVLSPRLVGDATALHPMAVLLLVSAGGLIAGTPGMVLAIPAVVSIRGALRGWRT